MSGDVQPRKRKDKKKKKDDGDFYASNEDLNLHVHKEGGTGGNVCSKIVFFFLFSALIVLVGLIIKENQGLNELESIETESRFSQIFEGWVDDKSADDHDDHSPEVADDDHDDEDHNSSEEDEVEEDESHDQDEDEELDDAVSKSEEVDETEEEPQSDEDLEQISDEEPSEESEVNEESEETEDSAEPTDKVASVESTEEQRKSDEQTVDSKESEEAVPEEVEETEGDAVDNDAEEETEIEAEEKTPATPVKPSSGVATKIGVGLALLIVAYNVFLRKRRPDIEKPKLDLPPLEEGPPPDLSRRNTLIPPPTLQEIEPDLPDAEIENEEYSEEEYSDDENHEEHRTVRDEYQELRTTYTRSMTPEGEFEVKDKHYEEDVLEDEEEPLDDEEIEDDYEIYDEDEDEELLRRLEAKYGKLDRDVKVEEEVRVSTPEQKLRENIEAAERLLHENAAYANKLFEALLDQNPYSPRVLYGKGKALDSLAEEKQSNQLLLQALNYYMKALNSPSISDTLYVQTATRYIDRARFMGHYKKAITVHWQLIERFPRNVNYFNNLAVTYLTVNMVEDARNVLETVLSKWPDDGFALVHYGFILKTKDNNFKDAVYYMTKGLQTKAPGVVDGRFYFHLGDALTRLGRKSEALKLYEEGVRLKVFKSKYQRSLYNIKRLAAKPWWEPTDLPKYKDLFTELQNNWREIRKEGLSILNRRGYFEDEAENLKDTGTWKQLELFARGNKNYKNCERTPLTCSIIENFPDVKGCRRGQTKFSVMHPGTHVWPHCGPTNCRLRIHLGLKVPSNTFIRVAEEIRSWREGGVLIFDDSFEHEVWHNGTGFRLVLIVDVWHPNLTQTEKDSLSPI